MTKLAKVTKATPAKAVKGTKPAKAATEKAPKAPKVEKPKVGKYGAPAQRVNRTTHDKSVFGNRKWVFRGVTEVNPKTNEFLVTDATECKAFPREQAEKILQKALTHKDVVNGRLYFKKTGEDGVEMRSVWVAMAADNGDHRIQKTA